MTPPKRVNPVTAGLPLTIPIDEAMRNLSTAEQRRRRPVDTSKLMVVGGEGVSLSGGPSRLATGAPVLSESVKSSYRVQDTTPSEVDLRRDLPETLLLEVTAIRCYDHNPRQYANERREDIRQGLKAHGFQGALVVTRRSPDQPYMLAAGSNTTLTLLQELYAETGAERYRWVSCTYQPFKSDAVVLAQHLGENLNRGDMRFWEVAVAMVDLLNMMAQEGPSSQAMSSREASEALAAMGLKADKSLVNQWRFAVTRLACMNQSVGLLTRTNVRETIQPRLSSLAALASRFGVSEDDYWNRVAGPALRGYELHQGNAETLDAEALCDAVEAELGRRIDEPVSSVRQMLSILKLRPDATLADLRAPSPNLAVGKSRPAVGVEPSAKAAAPSQAAQAPLALPPGLVRSGTTGQSQSPVAGSSRTVPDEASAQTPTESTTGRSAIGPLFEDASAGGDSLQRLHVGLSRLLETVGLHDTLCWRDEMPLGFFLDLPDPEVHRRRRTEFGSAEYQARSIKSMVWWTVSTMAFQWMEGASEFLDHSSAFYRWCAADTGLSPLEGTDIDRSPPDADAVTLARINPGPGQTTMRLLREVEELAAEVLGSFAERSALAERFLEEKASRA